MNTWRVMFKKMALAVLLPLSAAAVESYTPVQSDVMLKPWRWRHEKVLDGVGALCMAEAGDGSFWFGHAGGLTHYNGSNLERFDFEALALEFIPDPKQSQPVKTLLVLPNDDLLFIAGRALVLKSGSDWNLIKKDIGDALVTTQMVRLENGTVLLNTANALWQIHPERKEAEEILKASKGYQLDSYCMDAAGNLWIAECIKNRSARIVQIPFPNGVVAPESAWQTYPIPNYSKSAGFRVVAGKDGLIWVGHSFVNSVIQVLDTRTKRWLDCSDWLSKGSCFSMMQRRDGSIWIGESRRIKVIPRMGEEKIVEHEHFRLLTREFSMMESRNNRLWLLGRNGSVYSVDLGTDEWVTYAGLNYQCESTDGKQWFSSELKNPVVSYDPATGAWLKYSKDDGVIDRVRTIIPSSHGLVWALGSHEGRAALSVYDGKRWTRKRHPEFARWISRNAIEAEDGTLLFGARGPLLTDAPNPGGILQYEVAEGGEVQLLKHHAPPPLPYQVMDMVQAPDQTIWIASPTIQHYDPGLQTKEALSGLPEGGTVAITLDHHQSLWVAKDRSGIFRRVGDEWETHSKEQGLASPLLNDLITLQDGSLLAATDGGLSRFDGTSWFTYVSPDWYPAVLSAEQIYQSRNGDLWLNYPGNDQKMVAMAPEVRGFCTIRLRLETVPPDTRFVTYQKLVGQPGNAYISWSARDPWSGRTDEPLHYSWRLDGGEWSPFSGETSHTFLDLEPGKHTLEVRARDRAFNIDPTPDRIEFTVIPPIWKQPWFILLMILFVGVVVFLIRLLIRTNARHLEERQQEREAMLLKRQAEREKHHKEMDRLKTGFFTNVSHELRTPLTVVVERLRTVVQANQDEETVRSLSIVQRNVQRVAELITQLLDFRKIEEGKLKVQASYGDLVPMVRNWVDSLQVLAEQANVSLLLESVSMCPGTFDFDKLQKICTNLISNSIKYTECGGEVKVSLGFDRSSEESGRIRFMVEDNGVGIDPEHLPRIFDRFYRVTEATRSAGAGIGLNLTLELVTLLGGGIRAESPIHEDRDKPGSRFVVTLPTNAAEESSDRTEMHVVAEAHTEPTLPEPKPSSEQRPIVLIVEDDEEIRTLLIEGLEPRYDLAVAKDGAQGLQMAKERVPDLVVTDVMMPVMDGMTLCRELKTGLETSHIPVVMLTAKSALESEAAGLKTGADDYIRKPFNMDLLRIRIENLLASRQALREKFRAEFALISPEVANHVEENEFLSFATEVLEEHYGDPLFNPDRFAEALNMSRSSLQRKLKAVTDLTPSGFIQEFRMSRAAERLVNSSETIAEISFRVGCDEPSNFTRLFKKFYHMTPTQYRDQQR